MTTIDPSNEPTPQTQSQGVVVDPVLVMILNLFLAGCAGYYRIGQKQKAAVAGTAFGLLAFPTLCTGSLLLSLLAAIDGYQQAQELAAGRSIGQWTFLRQHVAERM